jgi:hypothetical protein
MHGQSRVPRGQTSHVASARSLLQVPPNSQLPLS